MNDLVRRYRAWSTEDLERAASVDREDYVSEALAAIDDELSTRGVTIEAEGGRELHDSRRKNEPRGVGGFLLLFVIAIFLGSLSNGLEGTFFILAGKAPFWIRALGLPLLLLSVYGFYVGWLLVSTEQKRARSHAVRYLIGTATCCLVIGVLAAPSSLISLPFIFLWLGYVTSSRRVALTYSEPGPVHADDEVGGFPVS